jgi:hypothetical protein
MYLKQGIRLLEEIIGDGSVAEQGDHVIYNLRIYLNDGEEFPVNDLNYIIRKNLKKFYPGIFTDNEGFEFINFNARLGQSDAIAGVRYSLYGMREGGYRKVKVSPHFAFREQGIPGKIPPNAIIIFKIWLRKIVSKKNKIRTIARQNKDTSTP